jgi:hypothetical protein
LFCLLFSFGSAGAQYYNEGTEPPTVKWQQVNTDNFQLIFPKGADSLAQHVSRYLSEAYRVATRSLDHKPRKISIILHTNTVRSNGFVAWAPKRSEWYVTPPDDQDQQDWLAHLTLHEYRHVVQTDKMYQGMTKVLATVFGEQGLAYSSGMLPFWYLEGDAVWAETALSSAGRGREPNFLRIHRTKLLSDERMFSFDQSVFGSYKIFTPNHYQTGYLLTAYGRTLDTTNGWQHVQNRVARFPHGILPTPWPFSRGMKKQWGMNQKSFYNRAMDSLAEFWQSTSPRNTSDYSTLTNEEHHGYTDYFSPVVDTDGQLYAIRNNFDDVSEIVAIRQGKSTHVVTTGPLVSQRISVARGMLAWSEWRTHPRWENVQFAEVWLFDTKRNNLFKVRSKTRWFSPALSPDGHLLVVVEKSETNEYALVFVNPFSGREVERVDAPGGHYIALPTWQDDGNVLWLIETSNGQKWLRPYHIKAKAWGQAIAPTRGDIQWMKPFQNKLFFHNTASGLDQLCVYDTKSEELHSITNDVNGIRDFTLAANGEDIIAKRYTSHGGVLVRIPVETLKDEAPPESSIPFQLAWKREMVEFNGTYLRDSVFEMKKYRRLPHLFNVHSWLPLYADVSKISQSADFQAANQSIMPGLTLLSQNKLSTTTGYFSYGYANSSHYLSSGITYRGLFPVFQLEARIGGEAPIQAGSSDWTLQVDEKRREFLVKSYLPLDFSQSNYVLNIRPQIEYNFINGYYYNYAVDYYLNGFEEVRGLFQFIYHKRMAMRDLLPEWGVLLQGNYTHSLKDEGLYGDIYYGYGIMYLKGLMRNDGFRFLFGYQEQDPGLYLYGTKLAFPRGYETGRTESLFLFRGSYHLPLAYPDWSLGSFAYIKRLRANVFYDYGKNTYQWIVDQRIADRVQNLHSVGGEVSIDAHFFRMILPVSLGLRGGFKPNEQETFFETFINLQLNQF